MCGNWKARYIPFSLEAVISDSSGIKPQESTSVKEVRQVNIQPYADNFVLVIPVDLREHTNEKPFCSIDPTCPCHEDLSLIDEVQQFVQEGLLTTQEARDFVAGRGI